MFNLSPRAQHIEIFVVVNFTQKLLGRCPRKDIVADETGGSRLRSGCRDRQLAKKLPGVNQ
jgi:hypothetical protein